MLSLSNQFFSIKSFHSTSYHFQSLPLYKSSSIFQLFHHLSIILLLINSILQSNLLSKPNQGAQSPRKVPSQRLTGGILHSGTNIYISSEKLVIQANSRGTIPKKGTFPALDWRYFTLWNYFTISLTSSIIIINFW